MGERGFHVYQSPRHPRIDRRLDGAKHTLERPQPYIRYRECAFSRASIATVLHPETKLVRQVANNVLRMLRIDDRLTGALIEGSRQNAVQRSAELDNAYWNFGTATATPNVLSAPDGAAAADRVETTGVTEASASKGREGFGSVGVASVYVRQTEAGTDATGAQISAKTGASTNSDILDTDFERIQHYGDAAGSARCVVISGKSGGPYAAGDRIVAWGMQFEPNGRFASSYIPTTNAAVTRAAESLIIKRPLPPRMISEGFTFCFVPAWGSNDVASGDIFTLFEFDFGLLRLRHDGTGVKLEALETGDVSFTRVASGNLTFSRGQALEFTWWPTLGQLKVRKATAGNATSTGTGFQLNAFLTHEVQVGASKLITNHAFGVVGEPYPAGTVLLPIGFGE